MQKTGGRCSVEQERLAGAVQELKLCERRDVTSMELEFDYHLSAIIKDL